MALDQIAARAAQRAPRILMIGQGDGSIEAAAAELMSRGVASVTIVGPGGIDPSTDPRLPAIAGVLRECWQGKKVAGDVLPDHGHPPGRA